MRTTKELLELMLEHQDKFLNGLCSWNTCLCVDGIISDEEYENLKKYINNNRPSPFSSLDAYKHRKWHYYWKPYNIKPRIKWIKKHIKKLSK